MNEIAQSQVHVPKRESAWAEFIRKDDWWAIWIGLGLVVVAAGLVASGGSLKWLAVAPQKWKAWPDAVGQVRQHAAQYLALFALWANVDESFLIGLLVLAASAVGRVRPDSTGGTRGPEPFTLPNALANLTACAVACLVNPSVFRVYRAAADPSQIDARHPQIAAGPQHGGRGQHVDTLKPHGFGQRTRG